MPLYLPPSTGSGGGTIASTTNVLKGDNAGAASASNIFTDSGYYYSASANSTTALGVQNVNTGSSAGSQLYLQTDGGYLIFDSDSVAGGRDANITTDSSRLSISPYSIINSAGSASTWFGLRNIPTIEITGTTAMASPVAAISLISSGITGGAATIADATTVYIDAAPSASGPTLTKSYALWVDAGNVRVDGGLSVGTNNNQTTGVVNVSSGFRIANAAATGKILQGDGTNYVASTPTFPTAAGTAGYTIRSDGTNFASYPQDMLNSSTANQTPSTADVYVTGSNIVVLAGDWKAKGQYRCVFDVTKTAGTGAIVISFRVGALGNTGDAARATFTFAAGTSVSDFGTFEVIVNWRTVGSGTSATIAGICRAQKNLITAAGLWGTTSAALVINGVVPGGFDSTTNVTNIGVSFNGSTAFAGTITTVQATLLQ